MPTEDQLRIAVDALRDATRDRPDNLSPVDRMSLAERLADRVILNPDGTYWWRDPEGSISYNDGQFVSPADGIRAMVEGDPTLLGHHRTAHQNRASNPSSTPVTDLWTKALRGDAAALSTIQKRFL